MEPVPPPKPAEDVDQIPTLYDAAQKDKDKLSDKKRDLENEIADLSRQIAEKENEVARKKGIEEKAQRKPDRRAAQHEREAAEDALEILRDQKQGKEDELKITNRGLRDLDKKIKTLVDAAVAPSQAPAPAQATAPEAQPAPVVIQPTPWKKPLVDCISNIESAEKKAEKQEDKWIKVSAKWNDETDPQKKGVLEAQVKTAKEDLERYRANVLKRVGELRGTLKQIFLWRAGLPKNAPYPPTAAQIKAEVDSGGGKLMDAIDFFNTKVREFMETCFNDAANKTILEEIEKLHQLLPSFPEPKKK